MPQIPFYAKEWRQYRKLSVMEAGKITGLGADRLNRLEARVRHFDEHDLAALSNAYALHPAMFFNLNPADPADREQLELALREWEGRI